MSDAAGEAERGLDRVGQAALGAGVVALGHEPVDDDLDGVLDLLLQLGRLGQRDDLAVDAGPREALGLELGEQVDVLALAALDDRREHLEAGAVGQLEQPVDDLLGLCRVIGSPQTGQCGRPARAKSRRR